MMVKIMSMIMIKMVMMEVVMVMKMMNMVMVKITTTTAAAVVIITKTTMIFCPDTCIHDTTNFQWVPSKKRGPFFLLTTSV